jgi:UDP-2,4-diacetamido-2,4,6-trideoxy-beta-L-altropyranose hydrolase
MGTGHVMRCLVLADLFKKSGAKVEFICRSHKGNSIDRIISSDFKVYDLPATKDNELETSSQYSQWLGVKQKKDADDCVDLIKLEKVNWVIVDHYGIDEQWHKRIKPYCEKLMVIDDLANRKFDCHLLLNQNLGIENKHYDNKVPADCILLLGTKYALLRPEFSRLRSKAIIKRKNTGSIKNIIISMGGNDINNITHSILENISNNYSVTVVLGKYSPHNKMLQNYVKNKNIKLLIDSKNMAELMLNADLAIGAGGSTSWERCCLSLPTFIFLIDENQRMIVKQLVKLGSVRLLENTGSIKNNLEDIRNDISSWTLMARKSRNICDGLGASRVRNYVK